MMEAEDVPGAVLNKPFEAATVPELKRWLKCRNARTSGKKEELIKRCKLYSEDRERNKIVDPDGGVWQQRKVEVPDRSLNQDSGEWTKSLKGMPKLFGEASIYELVGGSGEKHRVGGYNIYKSGKVQNILVKIDNVFSVRAVVAASFTKDRYNSKIDILANGKIDASYCKCKAGAQGKCKHVVAVLFSLNDMRLSGLSEIPEELACTQKPKEWGRRKCNVTVTGKFSDLDFVRHEPGKNPISVGHSKRRREYAVLPPSKQSLPKPRLDNYGSMLPEGSVRKLMLTSLWSSSEKSVSPVGVHPEHRKNVLQPCPLQNIHNKVSEQMQTWDFDSEEFKEMAAKFQSHRLSVNEIIQIERETRGQANSENWYKHRKGRITASFASQVAHRKEETPPDALLRRMLQYDPQVSSAATRHGEKYEKEAVHYYRMIKDTIMEPVEVEDAGLAIHPSHQFLGASVDGVVTDLSAEPHIGNIEIKCPYADIENLEELHKNRKRFCLTSDNSSKAAHYRFSEDCSAIDIAQVHSSLSVNTKHPYFDQMQTQMAITERKWCDFVVFSTTGRTGEIMTGEIVIQRVEFDATYWKEFLLPKLHKFYVECMLPEMISKRVANGKQLFEVSDKFTYRKKQ